MNIVLAYDSMCTYIGLIFSNICQAKCLWKQPDGCFD